jgi:hypothetical protein
MEEPTRELTRASKSTRSIGVGTHAPCRNTERVPGTCMYTVRWTNDMQEHEARRSYA